MEKVVGFSGVLFLVSGKIGCDILPCIGEDCDRDLSLQESCGSDW